MLFPIFPIFKKKQILRFHKVFKKNFEKKRRIKEETQTTKK